jgi:hypothetical protein
MITLGETMALIAPRTPSRFGPRARCGCSWAGRSPTWRCTPRSWASPPASVADVPLEDETQPPALAALFD